MRERLSEHKQEDQLDLDSGRAANLEQLVEHRHSNIAAVVPQVCTA